MEWRGGAAGVVLGAVAAFGLMHRGPFAAPSSAADAASHGRDDAGRALESGLAEASDASSASRGSTASADGAAREPWADANARLAADIAEYRKKLSHTDSEQQELKKKLAAAEARLAALTDGGGGFARSEFDITPEQWADMATRSELRYRIPCSHANRKPWTPDAETLQTLGLKPDDAAPIREAYRASNDRLWATMKPLCARILGNDATLAEKLGPHVCARVVSDSDALDESAAKAMATRVALVRAGKLAEPAPGSVTAHEALLLAVTGEGAKFEADLAKTFGPDEAKRLAYDDAMCGEGSWLGGSPAKK